MTSFSLTQENFDRCKDTMNVNHFINNELCSRELLSKSLLTLFVISHMSFNIHTIVSFSSHFRQNRYNVNTKFYRSDLLFGSTGARTSSSLCLLIYQTKILSARYTKLCCRTAYFLLLDGL